MQINIVTTPFTGKTSRQLTCFPETVHFYAMESCTIGYTAFELVLNAVEIYRMYVTRQLKWKNNTPILSNWNDFIILRYNNDNDDTFIERERAVLSVKLIKVAIIYENVVDKCG